MRPKGTTLLVAPYAGEFGWELMNWQARVRWLIHHGGHERVVVCAETDRRLLYARASTDGRVVFCPTPPLNVPGHRSEDHRVTDGGRPVPVTELHAAVQAQALQACAPLGIGLDEAVLFTPDFRSTIWPTTPTHQMFVGLRLKQQATTDVVLVPRHRHLAGERNKPVSWWDELAARLQDAGLTVESYIPRLDEAVRQFSRARLAVGASTGGMHLASLCRCPHYVWGSGAETRWTRLGITNRQRYETVWNPLGTPCRYDECGWQPPLAHVLDACRRALDEIGLPPGQDEPAWTLKPGWRMKRGFARLLEKPDGRGPWPWRLRNLVREHIV
jgi:hypothetical protein